MASLFQESLTPPQLLKVEYDYQYSYKTKEVKVKAGESLHLLQKTNEHWWKVVRPEINRPFFVPAQYVTEVGEDSDEDVFQNQKKKANGGKSLATKALSLPDGNSNANNKKNSFNGGEGGSQETVLKGKPESSKSKSKESSFFSFSKSGSKSNKINRNEGSRASHREKGQNHSKPSSKISSSSGKLKNWSASLEELSKQIVFPGLASESVADLTFATTSFRGNDGERENCGSGLRDNKQEDTTSFGRERSSFSSFQCDNKNQNQHSKSINKCLTFRNPAFSKGSAESTSEEKLEIGNSNHDIISEGSLPQEETRSASVNNMESDCTISRSVSGTITKESPKLPVTPLISPVRKLAEEWAEYYSPDCNRFYYYNSKTGLKTWKPPRLDSSINSRNSSSKKSDEHLGSLSDGSTNASSFEKSLDNIPDLVGSPNLSFEAELLSAEKTSSPFSANENVSNTVKLKESCEERSRSNESDMSNKDGSQLCQVNIAADEIQIQIPEGWDRQWDEAMQQICYVNKTTGARWFTSTDSQARVYYYEENSSNSSWFLPVETNFNQSQSMTPDKNTSLQEERASNEKSPDSLRPMPVKKRHSAGEVVDRNLKTKSLLIHTDLRRLEFDNKSSSLPRNIKSIWTNGKLDIIREGPIARSKITENGKKLRKSWGVVYAVLTEFHLSLFKDQKYFSALKTEVEIELDGASVEWTEEKSSRKNVFQLSTLSDLQMLFQVDDKELAVEWFEEIKYVAKKFDSNISMRLRSIESPDLLDPPVGERKISSRLNRNKSTKLRITTVDEVPVSTIKDHLKKFFSRRPARESLVKKGIYKDESVFGCSLEKLCMLEKRDVPRFVSECILAIESKKENLKTDGIYRASGNLSQVQTLRFKVDQNNMACLLQEDDVHVLAGCLKLFFRELKEPLIHPKLFEKALEASYAHTKEEKTTKLREIVNSLAKPNKCTLQALLKHLLVIAEHSEFNRMQIPNLAIVFGPTLINCDSGRYQGTSYAAESQLALDLMQQNMVIEALLSDYNSIFQ